MKKVYPDKKGLVRTVRVAYRKCDVREAKEEFKVKPLVEEDVAVQRLSVLLPVEKQAESE